MQRFADLAPLIALTKLDECETTAGEFSAYVEQGALYQHTVRNKIGDWGVGICFREYIIAVSKRKF